MKELWGHIEPALSMVCCAVGIGILIGACAGAAVKTFRAITSL